ncbi:uncharacterized protein LOC134213587 [Armigeres subalbatus]|uniref:uncharacterized protein LOC134213587 n=1 Tax=Armigeres subalbatus TaxID=124917 RepID=UPI002ED2FF0B
MRNSRQILWCVLCAIIVTNAVAQLEEDNPCIGNVGVLRVPDIEDCTRFILCVGGDPFPQQCSPGLIFDVITDSCNLEEISVCIQEVLTPPTPGITTAVPGEPTTPVDVPIAPTPAPEVPTAPTPGTTVPTAPTPAPTPAPPATTAAPPATTPAPPATTPAPPVTTPAPAPVTTAPPPSGGEPHCPPGELFYAPHPDCTRFFRCVFGTLFVLNCPPNQHWNQEREYCDHPWNVQC